MRDPLTVILIDWRCTRLLCVVAGCTALCLALAACGSEPPLHAKRPPPTVALTTAVEAPAPPAVPAVASGDHCTLRYQLGMCDIRLSTQLKSDLQERIDITHTLIQKAGFRNAPDLVELARLQMVRDNRAAKGASSDSLEAAMNAKRAVAVDDELAAARLVSAVSHARQLERALAPEARQLATRLVTLDAAKASDAKGRVGASANALIGFELLARGDAHAARAAFERAASLDRTCPAVLAGRGDLARHAGNFDDAETLYQQAAEQLGASEPLATRLRAAKERRWLLLPRKDDLVDAKLLSAGGPLAPKAATPTPCDAAALAVKEQAELCDGLRDAVSANSDPAAQRDAAAKIVRGFRAMRPLCKAKNHRCGETTLRALHTAAHLLRDAGKPAKGVALLRMLLRLTETAPGGQQWATPALIEMGDVYFSLGLHSQAIRFYSQAVRRQRDNFAVAGRALSLSVALGDASAATDTLKLLMVRKHTTQQRARWRLLAALAASPPDGADRQTWLRGQADLLQRDGLLKEANSLRARMDDQQPCEAALVCSHRLLAHDSAWAGGS